MAARDLMVDLLDDDFRMPNAPVRSFCLVLHPHIDRRTLTQQRQEG